MRRSSSQNAEAGPEPRFDGVERALHGANAVLFFTLLATAAALFIDPRRHLADARVDKFDPGQKLNAALVAGSIPVMLGTGAVMRWFDAFPLDWWRGATFVHDWLAVALFALVVGHVALALRAMLRR